MWITILVSSRFIPVSLRFEETTPTILFKSDSQAENQTYEETQSHIGAPE